MFWSFVGSSAAVLTMFSFVPQIVKVLRTRSAKDVSLIMLWQLSLGVTLWMAYGIHLKNIIIVTANAVTLSTLAVLLGLHSHYGRMTK